MPTTPRVYCALCDGELVGNRKSPGSTRPFHPSYRVICDAFGAQLSTNSHAMCNACTFKAKIMGVYYHNQLARALKVRVLPNKRTGHRKKTVSVSHQDGATVSKTVQNQARQRNISDEIPLYNIREEEELEAWSDDPYGFEPVERKRKMTRSYQIVKDLEADVTVRKGLSGYGLFAKTAVEKEGVIIEYTGDVVSRRGGKKRQKVYDLYGLEKDFILALSNGDRIDATSGGSAARFANHSCEPNSYFEEYEDERGDIFVFLTALEDIPAFSEITVKYSLKSTGDPTKLMKCACGARKCAKFI